MLIICAVILQAGCRRNAGFMPLMCQFNAGILSIFAVTMLACAV